MNLRFDQKIILSIINFLENIYKNQIKNVEAFSFKYLSIDIYKASLLELVKKNFLKIDKGLISIHPLVDKEKYKNALSINWIIRDKVKIEYNLDIENYLLDKFKKSTNKSTHLLANESFFEDPYNYIINLSLEEMAPLILLKAGLSDLNKIPSFLISDSLINKLISAKIIKVDKATKKIKKISLPIEKSEKEDKTLIISENMEISYNSYRTSMRVKIFISQIANLIEIGPLSRYEISSSSLKSYFLNRRTNIDIIDKLKEYSLMDLPKSFLKNLQDWLLEINECRIFNTNILKISQNILNKIKPILDYRSDFIQKLNDEYYIIDEKTSHLISYKTHYAKDNNYDTSNTFIINNSSYIYSIMQEKNSNLVIEPFHFQNKSINYDLFFMDEKIDSIAKVYHSLNEVYEDFKVNKYIQNNNANIEVQKLSSLIEILNSAIKSDAAFILRFSDNTYQVLKVNKIETTSDSIKAHLNLISDEPLRVVKIADDIKNIYQIS